MSAASTSREKRAAGTRRVVQADAARGCQAAQYLLALKCGPVGSLSAACCPAGTASLPALHAMAEAFQAAQAVQSTSCCKASGWVGFSWYAARWEHQTQCSELRGLGASQRSRQPRLPCVLLFASGASSSTSVLYDSVAQHSVPPKAVPPWLLKEVELAGSLCDDMSTGGAALRCCSGSGTHEATRDAYTHIVSAVALAL